MCLELLFPQKQEGLLHMCWYKTAPWVILKEENNFITLKNHRLSSLLPGRWALPRVRARSAADRGWGKLERAGSASGQQSCHP